MAIIEHQIAQTETLTTDVENYEELRALYDEVMAAKIEAIWAAKEEEEEEVKRALEFDL